MPTFVLGSMKYLKRFFDLMTIHQSCEGFVSHLARSFLGPVAPDLALLGTIYWARKIPQI